MSNVIGPIPPEMWLTLSMVKTSMKWSQKNNYPDRARKEKELYGILMKEVLD